VEAGKTRIGGFEVRWEAERGREGCGPAPRL